MWKDMTDDKKNFIKLLVISICVYLFMKYAFSYVVPFLLGVLIIMILNPFLQYINRHLKIGKGITIGIILFITGCIPGVVVFFLIQYLLSNMDEIKMTFMTLICDVEELFVEGCSAVAKTCNIDPQEVIHFCEHCMQMLRSSVNSSILPKLAGSFLVVVKWVSLIGAMWAVLIIFCIMLAKDYDKIRKMADRYEWFHSARRVGLSIYHMLTSYVRTQVIILLCIWIIVAVGTFLLGYEHFILIGLMVGVLEMLPFIGAGITLLPLAILNLISGNYMGAIGFLLLYGICVFIREYMEPKLMGKRTGLHPIVLLIAIFLGVRLFGLIGFITGPVAFMLIIEIYKEVMSK